MTVRRAIAWTFVAQGLYFVIQYGGSIILARLLSPKEMGVYSIAMTTIGLLAILQSLGLNLYIVREERLTPEKFGTAICINGFLAMLVAAATLLAAPLAGSFMQENGVRRVLTVLALSPLLGMLEFPAGTLMYRDKRFKGLAIIQIIKALVTACATVYGATIGWSYMSLAWGTLIGNAVGFLMINAMARPWGHFKLSLVAWRGALHFGSRMMAISAINSVAGRLPDFIAGRLLGLAALGIYGRAAGMLSLIYDNLYMSTTGVLVPSLAEHHRDGKSLRPTYMRALVLLTGIFWPALAGLAVMAGPLIHLFYGSQWAGSAPVLSLLCIANMLGMSLTLKREIFAIKGELDRQARIELMRGLCSVGLFYFGALYGLLFAAFSRILENVVGLALFGPPLARMTDMRLADFMAAYRKSAVPTAAAALPAAILMHLADWRRDIAFPYLITCLLAGVTGWLVAIFVLRHPLSEEIIGLRRAMASKLRLGPVAKS